MWGRKADKGDLSRRPMAAPGTSVLVLSLWDKAQLMLWLANLLYAVAVVLLMYAVLFLVVHLPWFPIRVVEVKGALTHVNYQQVSYIVSRDFTGNFFTLDLVRVSTAFRKLPWVRHVSVRRQWPDTLEVSVEEHVALGRWADGGLINTHGELFQAATDAPLPVLAGPPGTQAEVAQRYEAFREILAPLKLTPVQVSMNERRAWQIKLDNGLTLALGRERVDQRLAKFVRAYADTIPRMPNPVVSVDLRYPNGFAVRFAAAEKG